MLLHTMVLYSLRRRRRWATIESQISILGSTVLFPHTVPLEIHREIQSKASRRVDTLMRFVGLSYHFVTHSNMLLGLDTPFKFGLFIGYIIVWTSQSILVHLAAKRGIEYNYTTVVFLQDFCKMLITVFLFVRAEGNLADLVRQMVVHKKLAGLYLVPAGLYAIYNNLTFVSMSTFDPATYYVLLQAKLVVTAVLCVTLLDKPVSKMQWFSLLIITIGAMMKE